MNSPWEETYDQVHTSMAALSVSPWNPPPAHNVHRRGHAPPNRFANALIEDFHGSILLLCRDQHGCRFLQREMDQVQSLPLLLLVTPATLVFLETHSHVVSLMTDPFGNYLVQKLFEHVTPAQRLVLVQTAAASLPKVAVDVHGTRALQKLLECVSGREEIGLVVAALRPHVIDLARDVNGNHVVQKCLQVFGNADRQFVYDAISREVVVVASHRHGCCVLQRCFDHGSEAQIRLLGGLVASHARTLALDPYGNYVVQYVLLKGGPAAAAAVESMVVANVVVLATHKFGLNVVEKVLREGNAARVVAALLECGDLEKVLHDGYGNYVLQTALDGDAPGLAEAIRPLLAGVRGRSYARRLASRLA